MEDKEKPVLSDKNVIPDNNLLSGYLKDKMALWLLLDDQILKSYENATGTWNYYNDGKSWLYKMVFKKKTLFWGGLFDDTFRITFYFGDKAEPLIDASGLAQLIKDDFKTAKRYGAIRAISTKVTDKEDIDIILLLASIKVKLK
jgi:hypothetical protein